MVRVAINGFGRIGRLLLRILLEKKINVVAINSTSDYKTKAHLFKYDTVYGKYGGEVSVAKDMLIVGNKKIHALMERDPEKLPWKKLGIDIVIESTGIFRKREQAALHLKAGAKKVIISAPANDSDKTFCYGINHRDYDSRKHDIISTASCTTNALAPVAKVLNEKFGIISGFMTTVHAVTSSQNIIDNSHKDLRRARAGMSNIIPTTTGATVATEIVLPELQGKLKGLSLRVPVLSGSIIDFNVILKRKTTAEEINRAFIQASKGKLKDILAVTKDPIVSSDIVGDPHAGIIDASSTEVIGGNMAKVLIWYDNEYGYAHQLVRKLIHMAKAM